MPNEEIMQLIPNTIEPGRGANRAKCCGFRLGSVKERLADAENARGKLNAILNSPAYLIIFGLEEYKEELNRIAKELYCPTL